MGEQVWHTRSRWEGGWGSSCPAVETWDQNITGLSVHRGVLQDAKELILNLALQALNPLVQEYLIRRDEDAG